MILSPTTLEPVRMTGANLDVEQLPGCGFLRKFTLQS